MTSPNNEQIHQEINRMMGELGDKAGRVLPNPAARLKYEQWKERTLGEIRRLQRSLSPTRGTE